MMMMTLASNCHSHNHLRNKWRWLCNQCKTSVTSVKLSINLVQNMIQTNHELLTKQNIELSAMMSELSVNVADMNDRVVYLEKQFLSMDTKVEINRVNHLEVTDKINEMQNSLKCIKKKQTVSGETQHIVPNNKLERRLQLIEEKLSMLCCYLQKYNTLKYI